jgi:hypothetical protein
MRPQALEWPRDDKILDTCRGASWPGQDWVGHMPLNWRKQAAMMARLAAGIRFQSGPLMRASTGLSCARRAHRQAPIAWRRRTGLIVPLALVVKVNPNMHILQRVFT